MWQSLWKPSPSRKRTDNEVTNECKSNRCNKETNKNGHQLSQMTIKGPSRRGMLSSLYNSQNSTSVLNGESFVASTPATSMKHNVCDNEITSISAESTSYNNYQHNELQTSTQIENIQSEKLANSTSYIRNSELNANEVNSLSETPSRFQLPNEEKNDISKNNPEKERSVFMVGADTPKTRGEIRYSDSSGSAGKLKTPKGSRLNPFESHVSMDTIHLPTFSPSVFSTVLSPSQESSNCGRFWSIDQQAMLFPAKISEESPWKQETAISRLDADTENSTQEAIDLYFSQHHKITSPEDVPKTNVQNDRGSISLQNASQMTVEDLGGSPELRGKNISNDKMSNDVNLETDSSAEIDELQERKLKQSTRSTQTNIALPPVLPQELEELLRRFKLIHEDHDISVSAHCTSSPVTQKPQFVTKSFSRITSMVSNTSGDDANNLSNSTLRRKLFEGAIEDESDHSDQDEENMHDNIENEIDSYSNNIDKLKSKTNSVNEQKSPKYSNMSILSAENTNKKEFDNDDKENNQYVNVNITPGAMILTPKAKSVGPTPDRSLTWSLSPVSRKKKPRELVGPPIESSTPTK